MKIIKNDLIDKTKELAFKSYFGLMTGINEECYHLWLEDLKKWLRDKHNIHLDIWYNNLTEKYRLVTIYHNNTEYGFDEENEGNYEKILEISLEKAILLKTTKEQVKSTFDLVSILNKYIPEMLLNNCNPNRLVLTLKHFKNRKFNEINILGCHVEITEGSINAIIDNSIGNFSNTNSDIMKNTIGDDKFIKQLTGILESQQKIKYLEDEDFIN